jgi:hypothetical protein
MLVLYLYDFLNQPEFKHDALQEVSTSWNPHVVTVRSDADIIEVMLPEQGKVPNSGDTKADQGSVLRSVRNRENLLKLLED